MDDLLTRPGYSRVFTMSMWRSSRTVSAWAGPAVPAFFADPFRVLLTATAYILFQTLQQSAQGTACAGAQVATLRERLIKLAVWITRSARRIASRRDAR